MIVAWQEIVVQFVVFAFFFLVMEDAYFCIYFILLPPPPNILGCYFPIVITFFGLEQQYSIGMGSLSL